MVRTVTLRILLFLLVSVVSHGHAFAHHLCLQESSLPLGPLSPRSALGAKWDALKDKLGCALSSEVDTPVGNARVADFENGQIVFSPNQQMAVAGYVDSDGTLVIDWTVSPPFAYDFFLVRLTRIDGPDFADPKKNTRQQTVSAEAGGKTAHARFPRASGTYSIIVEGCDNKSFGSSACKQGWSSAIVMDAGYLDVTHTVDG